MGSSRSPKPGRRRSSNIGKAVLLTLAAGLCLVGYLVASEAGYSAASLSRLLGGGAAAPPKYKVDFSLVSKGYAHQQAVGNYVPPSPAAAPALRAAAAAPAVADYCDAPSAPSAPGKSAIVYLAPAKVELPPSKCSWVPLSGYAWPTVIGGEKIPVEQTVLDACTWDPAVDTGYSGVLHEQRRWANAGVGLSFFDLKPCSPERPLALDVGAGLGVWTLFAARMGCYVIAIEADLGNLQRAAAAVGKANLRDRVLFIHGAVGKSSGEGVLVGKQENRATWRAFPELPEGADAADSVPVPLITLADIFHPDAPPIPFPGYADGASVPQPFHVGIASIDVAGAEAGALWGGGDVFWGASRVPYMYLGLQPEGAAGTGCDAGAFARKWQGLSYSAYDATDDKNGAKLDDAGLVAAVESAGKEGGGFTGPKAVWLVHKHRSAGIYLPAWWAGKPTAA